MNVNDKTSVLSYGKVPVISMVVGHAIGRSVIAPIDRIKIVLQSQYENMRQGRLETPYKGPIDCISRTYASEGLRSFWRGNLSTCFLPVPTLAFNMALIEAIKTRAPTPKDASTSVTHSMLASGVASVVSTGVFFPFHYTRTRLAADVISKSEGGSNTRQFLGFRDLNRATFQSHGVKGFYRALPITVFGLVWHRSLYFGLYDTFKNQNCFIGISEYRNIGINFGLAFATTMLAGALSYPLDTIRVRLMMNNCSGIRYRGAVDCASYIFKNEGLQSFMKGFSVKLVYGVTGAVLLLFFDTLLKPR